MHQPRILLIVGGGIAAYKACELVRLIRRGGASVACVLTGGGAHFVTPMSLAALSGNQVYTSLWDLKDEAEMGHIQLSRDADLVVVCPATADLLAKMAGGLADDLATTLLLATDKPVLAVPAMNVRMWQHAATRRNIAWLRESGVAVMEPDEGPMACGEYGPGRLPEPENIWREIARRLGMDEAASAGGGDGQESGLTGLLGSLGPHPAGAKDGAMPDVPLGPVTPAGGPVLASRGAQIDAGAEPQHRPLRGRHVLVTAGPTHEPIDPVRYIANRSSGKQGFAIAAAAAAAGARVTLVAGPVALETPPGVERVDVESAREMARAVEDALPADAAVMVAAVADWRMRDYAPAKIKKRGAAPPALLLEENPDILAGLAASPRRPALMVGFAAETDNVLENASIKRRSKGVDWIVANDVSGGVMGGDDNSVHLIAKDGVESWETQSKAGVARRLVEHIARKLADG